MRNSARTAVLVGLRRIEGQVRGIQRMLDEDRYCIDVLTQMQAVRAAMHKLESIVLRDHVGGCVAAAFASRDPDERQIKLDELLDTIGRMTK